MYRPVVYRSRIYGALPSVEGVGVDGRFLEGSGCLCTRSSGRQCGQSGKHRSFEEPGVPRSLEIQYHYARELIRDGQIMLNYIPTADMLADLLTKSLPHVRHVTLSRGIGVF